MYFTKDILFIFCIKTFEFVLIISCTELSGIVSVIVIVLLSLKVLVVPTVSRVPFDDKNLSADIPVALILLTLIELSAI